MGSLSETGGSIVIVDGTEGEESSGSDTDSGWTDSNSPVSGLDNAAGELDDNVPAANFNAPSNTAFHENATVEGESASEGTGTSGS
jgi:hypothetical protein